MFRKLHTTARLMHTVAHPDDEDGAMLTLEIRGRGVEAAQVTLTRGEGGQNKTGNMFGDALGVLRTLELLAADKYYGVDQRFTRVADFGFSKFADETFQKWQGHDIALADIVRVIRTYRPDVVVTRFRGDSSDGHGQHQAAGILTREAFRAAADPNRFPEQIKEGLLPWQPSKLYTRGGPGDYTIELNVDDEDPILGASYAAFAFQGLKHQLSQGAGSWNLPRGSHKRYYKLIDTVLPDYHPQREKDFFDGLDTSLPGLAAKLGDETSKAPWLSSELTQLQKQVDQAEASAKADGAHAADPLLVACEQTDALFRRVAESSLTPPAKYELGLELATKKSQFMSAANLALGLQLAAVAERSGTGEEQDGILVAVPGRTLKIRQTLQSAEPVQPGPFELQDRAGTRLAAAGEPASRPSPSATSSLDFTVPPGAHYTRQYWHREDPDADAIYTVDEPQFATLALTPPPFVAVAHYTYKSHRGQISVPVEIQVGVPLIVGPAIAVDLMPPTAVTPSGDGVTPQLETSVRSQVGHANSTISVAAPNGWKVVPPNQRIALAKLGDQKEVGFSLQPAKTGEGHYQLRATAEYEGKPYSEGFTLITREDLGAAYFFRPAIQRLSVVDVKLPQGLKIGYIMGAGDDIPTVLKQLGLDVTLIDPAQLASADLSRYQTIVLGIRAYDTRPEVRENNPRLLDFVKSGGTLIVQYNQQMNEFNAGHYTPYAASEGRARVSVEEAPVDILVPSDSVFHTANEISASDFSGWVQERGLYFMQDWDDHYEPLLASHDPGEPLLKGGLLKAQYGRGTYIFTSYAFFRQLPAGVPGAIRLFVNLLAAGHEQPKARVAEAGH